MNSWSPWILPLLLVLLSLRWIVQLALALLNEHAALTHPLKASGFATQTMNPQVQERSIQYTLAKSHLGRSQHTFTTALLLIVLISGLVPWWYSNGTHWLGNSPAAVALVICSLPLLLSLTTLPFQWTAQFRLEEQFGFNTTTTRTWWMDRLKEFLLGTLIAYPLLTGLLSLPAITGESWWLYAWLVTLGFQLFLAAIAPVFVLPCFYRLTPLPPGPLRARLEQLAQLAGFKHRDIFLMDGSRRSRHSNAFFTGIGRFRRIVLYDTLVSQLEDSEIEAVLAHEIGHSNLHHIPRMFAFSASTSFLLFLLLDQFHDQTWLFSSLGFRTIGLGPLLLLIMLFGGLFSFWFMPVFNLESRRFEYQADAFAARLMGRPQPLIDALRKITRNNLSNLWPHPVYRGFYYSHPTLDQREQALLNNFPAAQRCGKI